MHGVAREIAQSAVGLIAQQVAVERRVPTEDDAGARGVALGVVEAVRRHVVVLDVAVLTHVLRLEQRARRMHWLAGRRAESLSVGLGRRRVQVLRIVDEVVVGAQQNRNLLDGERLGRDRARRNVALVHRVGTDLVRRHGAGLEVLRGDRVTLQLAARDTVRCQLVLGHLGEAQHGLGRDRAVRRGRQQRHEEAEHREKRAGRRHHHIRGGVLSIEHDNKRAGRSDTIAHTHTCTRRPNKHQSPRERERAACGDEGGGERKIENNERRPPHKLTSGPSETVWLASLALPQAPGPQRHTYPRNDLHR